MINYNIANSRMQHIPTTLSEQASLPWVQKSKRIQPHVIDEKALLVSISTESRCITEQVAKIQPMVAPAPQIEMSHPVERLKLGSGWNERES